MRILEGQHAYDDIDWLGEIKDGSINKLLVTTLDKYFENLNMVQCLGLKKHEKIQVLTSHAQAQM